MSRRLASPLLVVAALVASLLSNDHRALAQPAVTHSVPGAILPTGSTRIVLHGDKLAAPLRVWTSANVKVSVVSVEAKSATLEIAPQESLPLGPIGLWVATPDGPSVPLALLVDPLPSTAEQADNHSPVTAQTVGVSTAVDAAGDGKQFDYFRFHADADQELTFEVLAQHIGSTFDPVVRVLSEDGQELLTIDDEPNTPDSRFRHRFEKAGNYLLEIHDNRFAAGGRYRLRIGNFPLINFAYPPFVQRDTPAQLAFAGIDSGRVASESLQASKDQWQDAQNVTARFSSGGSPAWASVLLDSAAQMSETEPNNSPAEANTVGDARGINGLLQQTGDHDFYQLSATKDQSWRFRAASRSFGSPTLLKMTLRSSKGDVIGKTAVGDADEWQFDVKFPADGQYVLEVEDLLHRGGVEHGYHVSFGPIRPFSLALKADPKVRESLAIEPARGAAAIDLQVAREGYNGPIELRLEPPVSGLKILNPVIPTAAKEARIFLLSQSGWSADALAGVRCIGRATEDPHAEAALSSAALLVKRSPHVPYPPAWKDGLIALAGAVDQPAFFEVPAPGEPVALARSLAEGTVKLTLKRTQAEFKEAATLIHSELPPDWSATAKVEKDEVVLTLKHPVGASGDTVSLKLLWYAEFKGRGQVVETPLVVRLLDPLKVTLNTLPALKAGEKMNLPVEIVRGEGAEAQPVVLKLQNLPAGVTAPESVTIPPTETKAELTLSAAADAKPGKFGNIVLAAQTKFAGQDFTAQTAAQELELLAP